MFEHKYKTKSIFHKNNHKFKQCYVTLCLWQAFQTFQATPEQVHQLDSWVASH